MAYGIDPLLRDDLIFYRFGRAQQVFRAPRPDLRRPYCAFIGGSETFGKHVRVPFPALLQDRTGIPAANFGTPGAGPGFFLSDPAVLQVANAAELTVVQVMSPAAVSNRMYSVYPRRNTRLYAASETLRMLYPEVDFKGFRFVRWMLWNLERIDPARFAIVLAEIHSAWLARTAELLGALEGHKILLWIHHPALEKSLPPQARSLLRRFVEEVVEIEVGDRPGKYALGEPEVLDEVAHLRIAAALQGPVEAVWEMRALRATLPRALDWVPRARKRPA